MKKSTSTTPELDYVLESAEQVRQWNKHGSYQIPWLTLLSTGLLLGALSGVILSMIVVTPSILEACK